MTDLPAPQESFDPDVLSHLACPACYGDLQLEGSRIVCASCSRTYPIIDGIPVLIVERATQPAKES